MRYLREQCKVPLAEGNKISAPFILACEHGCFDVVKYMYESGEIDVNSPSEKDKTTPLIASLLRPNEQVTSYLLQLSHLNVNAIDSYHSSALDYALSVGSLALLRKMINLGAKGSPSGFQALKDCISKNFLVEIAQQKRTADTTCCLVTAWPALPQDIALVIDSFVAFANFDDAVNFLTLETFLDSNSQGEDESPFDF